MMTNTFEYSLQVVNPKLTVPYWDFTIESSTMGGNAEGVIEPQSSSPVFSSDWFGRHDAEDYQVQHVKRLFGMFVNRAFETGGLHERVGVNNSKACGPSIRMRADTDNSAVSVLGGPYA